MNRCRMQWVRPCRPVRARWPVRSQLHRPTFRPWRISARQTSIRRCSAVSRALRPAATRMRLPRWGGGGYGGKVGGGGRGGGGEGGVQGIEVVPDVGAHPAAASPASPATSGRAGAAPGLSSRAAKQAQGGTDWFTTYGDDQEDGD